MGVDEQRRVGERIRQARLECGLTQRELANRIGVTMRSVQNYESGRIVPYRHLAAIESLARKRRGWILEGEEHERSALLASIASQTEAMERQHARLVAHVEELQRQIDQLREHREAGRRRRSGE